MSLLSVVVDDIKTDIAEVEGWMKATNWSETAKYYDDFVKGLETVVEPVLEALFPGTTSTVSKVVNPLLASANVAVASLMTAAQDYAAGNLSANNLAETAHTVQAAVVAANVIVGAAIAGKPAAVPAAK